VYNILLFLYHHALPQLHHLELLFQGRTALEERQLPFDRCIQICCQSLVLPLDTSEYINKAIKRHGIEELPVDRKILLTELSYQLQS